MHIVLQWIGIDKGMAFSCWFIHFINYLFRERMHEGAVLFVPTKAKNNNIFLNQTNQVTFIFL